MNRLGNAVLKCARGITFGRMTVLAVALVLLFAAMPVKADSIDFNFQNGTLSYNAAGVLTGTVMSSTLVSGPELQVARDGSTDLGPYSILGTLSFTTGTLVSGDGSAGSPYDWAPGGGITVTAGSTALVNGVSLAGDSLLTGTFTGAETATVNGTNATFTADFVTGTTNAALLAALGFAPGTSVTGVITENFVITSAPGAQITASLSSGDLTVTPTPTATPEPGTLALLGAGLLGMAGMSRRRITNQ